MTGPPAIPGLRTNPRVGDWIEIAPDGRVVVKSGKVEIGQHVHLAIRQIAADALGVALGDVEITPVATGTSPNEGLTAGSLSIEHGGGAVHVAAAAAAALLKQAAAARLGVNDVGHLAISGGRVLRDGAGTGLSLAALAADVDWTTDLAASAPAPLAAGDFVGRAPPSAAAAAIVRGAPVFIQDLVAEDLVPQNLAPEDVAQRGLRHVRMLRHRRRGATVTRLDSAAILALEGVDDLVAEGSFIALLGDDEDLLVRVAEAACGHVAWDLPPAVEAEGRASVWLPRLRHLPKDLGSSRAGDEGGGEGDNPARPTAERLDDRAIAARFSRPVLLHGSIAPSCALARRDGGRLEVWTHSQGIYPLRAALARALGLAADDVVVRHVPGAGCYGHNGADDAAMDAALVAMRRPGRPVRVVWSRHDDMAVAPCGAPMVTGIEARLGPDGRIAGWSTRIWSAPHSQRPGGHGNLNLLAAEEADPACRAAELRDVPPAAGGGAERNARPAYAVPDFRLDVAITQDLPVRSSAIRALGAHLNTVAIEAMMDDLADLANADPVGFRTAHLDDPRARAVIEEVAGMAGLTATGRADDAAATGAGLGLGFGRYKNSGAYAAVVAMVELGEEVRLARVWASVDAGLLVNPDGALNQVEGGLLQSASWTLKEEAPLRDGGIGPESWEEYPVLGFPEVPEVEIRFRNAASGLPPLGVGECVQGPMAAAIGNAVARALGTRIHDLPFSRQRLLAALG